MINNKRRKHSPESKAAIVLELLSGGSSVAQMAKKHHIKDSLIYECRREAIYKLPLVFVQRQPEQIVDAHAYGPIRTACCLAGRANDAGTIGFGDATNCPA